MTPKKPFPYRNGVPGAIRGADGKETFTFHRPRPSIHTLDPGSLYTFLVPFPPTAPSNDERREYLPIRVIANTPQQALDLAFHLFCHSSHRFETWTTLCDTPTLHAPAFQRDDAKITYVFDSVDHAPKMYR